MPARKKETQPFTEYNQVQSYEYEETILRRFCVLVGALPDEWFLTGYWPEGGGWMVAEYCNSHDPTWLVKSWYREALPF